jgi:hypothetical protein
MNQRLLEQSVKTHLNSFYDRRIAKLSKLELKKTLKRKNPYLFRAVGLLDANEVIERLLSDFMSSSDETIFGDAFFEPLAKDLGEGTPSPTEGVDVAIETETAYKVIAVKSGPSVFNAQSRRRQNQDFQALRSRMMKLQKHFDAIVGYAYGRKFSLPNENKIFKELAGQTFWAELTGEPDCYLKIIETMQDMPIRHKDQFNEEWAKAKNRFAKEFIIDFCDDDGSINWSKLLEFNSGSKK